MTRAEILARALMSASAKDVPGTSLAGMSANPAFQSLSLDEKVDVLKEYAKTYGAGVSPIADKFWTRNHVRNMVSGGASMGIGTALGTVTPLITSAALGAIISGKPLSSIKGDAINVVRRIGPLALGLGAAWGVGVTAKDILSRARANREVADRLRSIHTAAGTDHGVSAYELAFSLPGLTQHVRRTNTDVVEDHLADTLKRTYLDTSLHEENAKAQEAHMQAAMQAAEAEHSYRNSVRSSLSSAASDLAELRRQVSIDPELADQIVYTPDGKIKSVPFEYVTGEELDLNTLGVKPVLRPATLRTTLDKVSTGTKANVQLNVAAARKLEELIEQNKAFQQSVADAVAALKSTQENGKNQ